MTAQVIPRMKILHINPDHPFTPLYTLMLDAFSAQHSHTVYVPLAVGRKLPERYSPDPSRVIHSMDYRQLHRVFYWWKTRKILKSLVRQMDVQSFDLVHAHFLFSSGGVAYLLRKKFGLRYVVSVQNTDVNIFLKYGFHLRKSAVRILQNAERVIFPNPAYFRLVIHRYVPDKVRTSVERRSKVIPFGIDSFWLARANERARRVGKERLSLLYVGKFSKNKNVETVVEVAKLLRSRGYDVTLDLVGDGPTFSRIQKRVRDLSYVRLHGHIASRERLLDRYRQADIFIMPSFTETFGLVYVEAMSQGLPVLYSKGQGIDGYFPEGTVGYSIDPHSPSSIADKVEEIIRNYEKISERCVWEARRFSWSQISRELEQLYEAACGPETGVLNV